jgi:hypothetical protein
MSLPHVPVAASYQCYSNRTAIALARKKRDSQLLSLNKFLSFQSDNAAPYRIGVGFFVAKCKSPLRGRRVGTPLFPSPWYTAHP